MEPYIPPFFFFFFDYGKLIKEIGDAHRELGNLAGSLRNPIINPDLLITPLLTKEAVLSSAIEGTVATVEEVFRYEADVSTLDDEGLRRDAQEIVNYRHALEVSMEEIQKRALGENLLKQAHYILLDSVRGARKNRGYFRSQVVYIGKPGSSIDGASFIPAPPEKIPELLRNWEEYINSKDEKDPLVQIAVAHYQFEAIHPFLDGNGRIGRLVIPLFLCDRGLLPNPILYISEYFETNRDAYIDSLRNVEHKGDWENWIRFFLRGVQIQAVRTQQSIMKIMALYESLRSEIEELGLVYGVPMLDAIFIRPVVNYKYLKGVLGASPQTIYNLLHRFENKGILFQLSERSRNRIYVFRHLIQLLD